MQRWLANRLSGDKKQTNKKAAHGLADAPPCPECDYWVREIPTEGLRCLARKQAVVRQRLPEGSPQGLGGLV